MTKLKAIVEMVALRKKVAELGEGLADLEEEMARLRMAKKGDVESARVLVLELEELLA